MILPKLLKTGVAPILVTFMVLLQITACNSNTESVENINEPGNSTDVRLSWTAPSEREDNKPISLSEISGYTVYFGKSPNNYNNKIVINDGSADGYTVKNLSTGTYYFSLTTYDIQGRESRYSPPLKIVV